MGKTKLNTSQKQQVGQFQGITGASKEQAAQCLQSSQWNVELAINFFFNQGLTASTSNDNSAITSLYEKYRDKQEDAILADGVGRFCQDLQVDPSDIVTLVISWHFQAATMCEFSKNEFVEGMEELGCNSIDSLRHKLPQLRSELTNEKAFRDIYYYAYGFALKITTVLFAWISFLNLWVPLSMSIPGVSRRLADLIEASFPDKTRHRRNAREQDKMTKSEADWSAGVMIRPNTWGNSAYLQDHDGEVTMESQRALRPSNHTQVEDQLEDTPGLPSPYTGSPGDSLTSPTRSPRQGLASSAGQAGQSYADDTALSPTQTPVRSHDLDRPLTPSDYDNTLVNGTADLPGPEASASIPRLMLPFEDSPEPPPESLARNSSSSAHDASAAPQHQQLPDVQPPNLGSPAHALTSARHRPYYRHVRLAAASEQFGSVLSERRGQPNGRHTASSAPAAAMASTVALGSEANVGQAHQSGPRNENNESSALPLIAQTGHRPANSASSASWPELFEGLAPAITSFAQTMPSPRNLPFTMGVQRHPPARSSRRSQGMVSSAAMNPRRFRNRMHSRRRRLRIADVDEADKIEHHRTLAEVENAARSGSTKGGPPGAANTTSYDGGPGIAPAPAPLNAMACPLTGAALLPSG
ncbi:hypothetical protein WJX79_009520 [Trebouxia sp. C0005]